jgi:hypothetical protein
MVTTILGIVRTGHHLEHTHGARDGGYNKVLVSGTAVTWPNAAEWTL